MLKIDPWNIIWTIVNLLFLYFVFKKFLFDRVMDVINKRDEMIKQQFASAQKEKDDAAALKEQYHEKLDSAKKEADQIIIDARARAEEEQERTLERTRDEAEHMLEKARTDIENEKEHELNSQRHATKLLISELVKYNENVEKNIFKSASNVNLNKILGYKKDKKSYSFLDDYEK